MSAEDLLQKSIQRLHVLHWGHYSLGPSALLYPIVVLTPFLMNSTKVQNIRGVNELYIGTPSSYGK